MSNIINIIKSLESMVIFYSKIINVQKEIKNNIKELTLKLTQEIENYINLDENTKLEYEQAITILKEKIIIGK